MSDYSVVVYVHCICILVVWNLPGEVAIVLKFSPQKDQQVLNLNFEFYLDVNWCRLYLPYTHCPSIINSQGGSMVCVHSD
jgi:hypothetical protein